MATTVGHYFDLEMRTYLQPAGRLAQLRALRNAPGATRASVAAAAHAAWGAQWQPPDAELPARALDELAAELP